MIVFVLWWRVHRALVLRVLEGLFVVLAVVGIVLAAFPDFRAVVRRFRPPVLVGGTIDLEKLSAGPHTLTVRAGDASTGRDEDTVTIRVLHDTTRQVAPPLPPPIPGQDAPDEQPLADDPTLGGLAAAPGGTVVLREAEVTVRLRGDANYSGVVQDGDRSILALSRPDVVASYFVRLPQTGRYLVEFHARHDLPAPVEAEILLNGRSWKRLVLRAGDGQYHTSRVGILRNFSSGVIGVRFLNDFFDGNALRSCLDNATCLDQADRNLYLDWIRFIPVE